MDTKQQTSIPLQVLCFIINTDLLRSTFFILGLHNVFAWFLICPVLAPHAAHQLMNACIQPSLNAPSDWTASSSLPGGSVPTRRLFEDVRDELQSGTNTVNSVQNSLRCFSSVR